MNAEIKTVGTYALSDGPNYTIPFDFLSRKFVVVSATQSGLESVVLTNGVDYRYTSRSSIVLMGTFPEGYSFVEIRRTTGSEPVVDFNDGSVLRASDLNVSQLQSIHIAEEGRDQSVDIAKGYVVMAAESAAQSARSAEEGKEYAAEARLSAVSAEEDAGIAQEAARAAQEAVVDTTLRSHLAGPAGSSLVGFCKSLGELRAIDPTVPYQRVTVAFWDISLSVSPIDVTYVYDPNDSTSGDDGVLTIVTTTGKRFKLLAPSGIDLRYAGLRPDGSNLGTTFNRVFNAVLAKVLALGTAVRTPTILIPNLASSPFATQTGPYSGRLNQSIKIPSFIPIEVDGNHYVEFTPITDVAIQVTNQIAGVVPGLLPWRDMQGIRLFANRSGRFKLIGPGATSSQAAGMRVGNTATGPNILDLRDLNVSDMEIRRFQAGLEFDAHDTYILTFERMALSGNYWGIAAKVSGKGNAGEKIVVFNSLIADSTSHGIHWNTPGVALTLRDTSMDYCGGHVINLDNGARGVAIKVEGGHIEGWGGMLVNQIAQSVPWYNERSRVTIGGDCEIKAAGGVPGAWASRRKILHSAATLPELGVDVFINSPIYFPAAPSEPHLALMGYTDTTSQYMHAVYNCPSSPYPDCLVSYRQTLNNGNYRFSGTPGLNVKGTVEAGTGLSVTMTGTGTATYGTQDADGFQYINVTLTNENDWIELCNRSLRFTASDGTEINSGISVMMKDIQSGTLKLNARLRFSVDGVDAGYNDGTESYDVSALLTAEYEGRTTPLTTSKYVGVQSAFTYNNNLGPANKNKTVAIHPAIVLRGIVGTIQLKLPVMWQTNGKGTLALLD